MVKFDRLVVLSTTFSCPITAFFECLRFIWCLVLLVLSKGLPSTWITVDFVLNIEILINDTWENYNDVNTGVQALGFLKPFLRAVLTYIKVDIGLCILTCTSSVLWVHGFAISIEIRVAVFEGYSRVHLGFQALYLVHWGILGPLRYLGMPRAVFKGTVRSKTTMGFI